MATVVRWAVRGFCLIALIVGGHQVIGYVSSWLDLTLLPHTEDILHRSIVFGTAIYVVMMAIPFVPGAEIGLTLLTVLGGPIAPLIYLASAASLVIAYSIGRLLPPEILKKGLAGLGLKKAASFVEDAAQLTHEDLQQHLAPASAPKIVRVLVRFRYVALALAINTPGNVVLGGGGGIALMAGLCRLFAPLPFLLTVLIAVLPVPLLFFLGQL